jgi:hypothetical protein
VDGQLHAPGRFTPGKGTHFIGDWVGPRTGLDGCEISRPPTGIRSPDLPVPALHIIVLFIIIY